MSPLLGQRPSLDDTYGDQAITHQSGPVRNGEKLERLERPMSSSGLYDDDDDDRPSADSSSAY
jgi:hypothetical protein